MGAVLRLGDPPGGWDCISGQKEGQGVGISAKGTGEGLMTHRVGLSSEGGC